MNIDTATTIAQSPAVWALCTIIITAYSLSFLVKKSEKNEVANAEMHREYRNESKEIQRNLFKHLERYDEALEKSNETQLAIVNTIERLDNKIDYKFAQIDKRIEKIEDKIK